MVVDFLRSAYSSTCRFNPGGPVRTIKWYRCSPEAKPLGIPTVFMSANYVSKARRAMEDSPDLVGELPPYRREWWNGETPVRATGQQYCGTEAGFLGQGTDLEPPGRPLDDDGIPLACSPGEAVEQGDLELSFGTGGQLTWTSPLARFRGTLALNLTWGGALGGGFSLDELLELDLLFRGTLSSSFDLGGGILLDVGPSAVLTLPWELSGSTALQVAFTAALGTIWPVNALELAASWGVQGYVYARDQNSLRPAGNWSVFSVFQSAPGHTLSPAVAWTVLPTLRQAPPNEINAFVRWSVQGGPVLKPVNALSVSGAWTVASALTIGGTPVGA